MINILWLGTEASAEQGFGLNLNLLDTNLINLGILIAVLLYFAPGFIGKILNERPVSYTHLTLPTKA